MCRDCDTRVSAMLTEVTRTRAAGTGVEPATRGVLPYTITRSPDHDSDNEIRAITPKVILKRSIWDARVRVSIRIPYTYLAAYCASIWLLVLGMLHSMPLLSCRKRAEDCFSDPRKSIWQIVNERMIPRQLNETTTGLNQTVFKDDALSTYAVL